ncbi:hypothetical protein DPMN_027369 [Dreissena polymorpha]|uniref:Uncharacterized protein n=1 Tax=Dreissena polymorpha TaxID=45954 RepID=A0A9D4LSR4_DREPO|nr:hypothetical protein DPMN_027369 [Dreissena polymorpha]
MRVPDEVEAGGRNESDTQVDIPDDCGAWDSSSGTTVNQLFTVSSENKKKDVFQKNGHICAKKIVNKKITYVPMEPQPEDIITLHRYYTKLKDDQNYEKRSTTVKEAPVFLNHLKGRAIVE